MSCLFRPLSWSVVSQKQYEHNDGYAAIASTLMSRADASKIDLFKLGASSMMKDGGWAGARNGGTLKYGQKVRNLDAFALRLIQEFAPASESGAAFWAAARTSRIGTPASSANRRQSSNSGFQTMISSP